MSSQRKAIVYSNIKQFTEQGHEALHDADLTNAAKNFSQALEKAELYGDEYLIRACSFNLGSCLVAFGQPSRGLVYLTRAIPPKDQSDGIQNFADLEYNIGIAKHAIGDVTNATEAYQKASNAYRELDNIPLQIETLSKLAICYKTQSKPKEAAEKLKVVVELYHETNDIENRAIALSHLTMLLAELKQMEECSKTLSTLLEVCHELENAKLKGKIYHDIGLLYSSENCYKSASECFEHSYHALEEVKRENKDVMLEAVVLMNHGAALNHLELYERAIVFHNLAIAKFGETGDKHSRSQAFCNLAYAHCKTEEYEEAKTAFQNAIECCKECDEHTEAGLATEGLAAIYFRESDYDSAIRYYKEALAILTKSDTVNTVHSERIVNKLAEAVEYQLNVKEERDEVDTLTNEGRRRYGKRRGKPRYGTVNSLVAKGLEETNDELEEAPSSEVSTDASDESESLSERRNSEDEGKPGFYERLSDNGSRGKSEENEHIVDGQQNKNFVNNRRDYNTHSFTGTNGRIYEAESEADEEPTRRQTRRARDVQRARNSKTCIIQ